MTTSARTADSAHREEAVGCIAKAGWTIRSTAGGWALSGVDRPHRQLFLSLGLHWGTLHVPLAAEAAAGGTLLRMLNWNARSYWARVQLDPAHRLVLCVDFPLAPFDEDLVRQALDTAGHYATAGVGVIEPRKASRREAAGSARRSEPDTASDGLLVSGVNAMSGDGWNVRERSEDGFRLMCKRSFGTMNGWIVRTPSWYCLQLPLLAGTAQGVLDAGLAVAESFLASLLRINDQLFLAKLGLDPSGQVLLLMELPSRSLSIPLLRMALRTLTAYVDRHTQEIQLLASLDRDPELRSWLVRDHQGAASAP